MVAEPVANTLLPPLLTAIARASLEWKRLTHNWVPGAPCAAPIAAASAGCAPAYSAVSPRQQTAAIFIRPLRAEGRRARIAAVQCTSEVSSSLFGRTKWLHGCLARLGAKSAGSGVVC